MEFCSNWLRLITLCENVTLFWSCGPDCKDIMPSSASLINDFIIQKSINEGKIFQLLLPDEID